MQKSMNYLLIILAFFTVSMSFFLVPAYSGSESAIRTNPGFNSNILARNDDGSTNLVPIGFSNPANFFGDTYSGLYVNNNGGITFDSPLSAYTPFPLTSTTRKIIAPFFSDIDTRSIGSPVKYGTDTIDGHPAFGVNWIDVNCYLSNSVTPAGLNKFQLVLIDRSDRTPGDFDFEFNYEQILWETGTASGGNAMCLGGGSARAGFSHGTGEPGTFFELPGSGVPGAFLDGGPASTALIHNSLNSPVLGRYIFQVQNGDVPVTDTISPEIISAQIIGPTLVQIIYSEDALVTGEIGENYDSLLVSDELRTIDSIDGSGTTTHTITFSGGSIVNTDATGSITINPSGGETIQDSAGNQILSDTLVPLTDGQAPEIISAQIIGPTLVQIIYSEDALVTGEIGENYDSLLVSDELRTIDSIDGSGTTTHTITFSGGSEIGTDDVGSITINPSGGDTIKDSAGNQIQSDTIHPLTDGQAPQIISAQIIGPSVIQIIYSENAIITGEIDENYDSLVVAEEQRTIDSIEGSDTATHTITFSGGSEIGTDDVGSITINPLGGNTVKDNVGNQIQSDTVLPLDDGQSPKVISAHIISTTKVQIIYSENAIITGEIDENYDSLVVAEEQRTIDSIDGSGTVIHTITFSGGSEVGTDVVGSITINPLGGNTVKDNAGNQIPSDTIQQLANKVTLLVSANLAAGQKVNVALPENPSSGSFSLSIKLPDTQGGKVTIKTTDAGETPGNFSILGNVIDFTAPCSNICEISFTFTQAALDAAGITLDQVTIFHDSNENLSFEEDEAIETVITGDDPFIATANAGFTSKFSVGGIKALALGALAGGGSFGGPPSFGTSSFAIIEGGNEGYAGIINDNDPDTLEDTQIIKVGQKAVLRFDFTEGGGIGNIDHIGLYTNVRDGQKRQDSNAYIYYDSLKSPKQSIHDPTKLFSDVKFDLLQKDTTNFVLKYELTFAKPMEKSDIIIESWNIQKWSTANKISNAIEVMPLEILQKAESETSVDNEFESPVEQLTQDITNSHVIPVWVKTNAKWWSENKIDNQNFISGIEFLVNEEIIKVTMPATNTPASVSELQPWIKNTAGWWADDMISNDEFLKAIEWLITNNIIQIL